MKKLIEKILSNSDNHNLSMGMLAEKITKTIVEQGGMDGMLNNNSKYHEAQLEQIRKYNVLQIKIKELTNLINELVSGLTEGEDEFCEAPKEKNLLSKNFFARKHGDCNVNDLGLTTLYGAPGEVSGTFNCSGNKLTSLEYCPTLVCGDFDCGQNKTQFTEGEILSICTV